MTTNGTNNIEDADMAECDGEKVVTMMDVLQEQQDFEDDANAVLGASDEKNCTYSKGYIKRQAIYACLTCCTEAKDDPTKRAGVCLACSLNCHENHELIELYTKRNFRCDCGNPKFNSHPCQFTPDKTDLNEDNKYNQNFAGLYCNCHRPYPDPESTVEDEEMIQCIICEDWLHSSHLDAAVPSNDQYSEMICHECMNKNEFLNDYSDLAVNFEMGEVDIIAVNGTDAKIADNALNTDKILNVTSETSEDSTENEKKIDVNIEGQDQIIKDKSPAENKDTTVTPEVEETTKPVEISNDTLEAKKTEEPSQTSIDPETKNETPITADEKIQPTSGEQPESEIDQNMDTIAEQNNSKVEESSNNSDKTTENVEGTEIKIETAEIAVENNKENEMTKLDSEDKDPMSENVKLTAEHKNDESMNTNTANLENDNEVKVSNKEVVETTNANLQNENAMDKTENPSDETPSKAEINDKTDNTEINNSETHNLSSDTCPIPDENNKPNSIETDMPSSESISDPQINNSKTNMECDETSKDVSTDDPSVNSDEIASQQVNNAQDNKNKRKLSTEEAIDDNLVKKTKLNEESRCTRPKGLKRVHKGATFWPSHFRQKLCTCSECLAMYKDLSVLFLLDPEDTVFAYEALGKERVDGRPTQYEKGLEALSSLDRIQQINALTEYNKMKDKLLDFLQNFKDRKEVVKEEDIKAFFAGMKPKREPDGVYFCR